MTQTAATTAEITVTEERFPRYDPAHGTPDPMVRRMLTLRLPNGHARFEQTDYGHPGRFNGWEPRGIETPLQPRTNDLKAVCDALTPLLG
ncbi:MAG TPA: hypothetical protein VEZ14_09235 [Dehalococcoidia bacterium]|nr:hypothetical protein [Dehalococcoidia bacterium]